MSIPRVLVALPVYNERRHVHAVLDAVRSYAEDIMVVDDGSTDGTADILRQYTDIQRLTHAENEGYGRSLIDAFAWASHREYDWVITLDCDHQHEPSCIPRFKTEIERGDVDIVSGSRYLLPRRPSAPPPPERVAINRIITDLLNRHLHLALTDAFCGFKAYRTSVVASLELTEKGYGLPLQLWILAGRASLRIREIPVPLIYHDPTRCFPGGLSDPATRLRYYLQTIQQELGYGFDRPIETNLYSERSRDYFHVS